MNLTSITFEEGSVLKSIGSGAFSDCSNLTSITIPRGVESIGDHAFSNCINLTSITFEEGSVLKSIGNAAFYNCINLTSITIPFVGATKDGTENTYFGYIFGAYSYSSNSSCVPSSLKTVVITGGISIGEDAFRSCSNITSITIPSSVESLGEEAFSSCKNLTSVTFEEGSVLKSIGDHAFYKCSKLTSITIPSGVESIGNYAFAGDWSNTMNLTNIIIPSSVEYIGYRAFWYCSNLTTLTFVDTSNWYKVYYNDGSEEAKTNWQNKTNGELVEASELSNANTNASNFSDNYYWYKKDAE